MHPATPTSRAVPVRPPSPPPAAPSRRPTPASQMPLSPSSTRTAADWCTPPTWATEVGVRPLLWTSLEVPTLLGPRFPPLFPPPLARSRLGSAAAAPRSLEMHL